VNLTEAAKRLLIGRKLASYQPGETLLPKRIALPVFASDALSRVAYAPDEILLTLSLAGMSAFAFSWKIGLLVAAVMLVVVASYRQTVHAYPSGGGDYEVATVNLGPTAGLTVAARFSSTTRSRWRSRFLRGSRTQRRSFPSARLATKDCGQPG
jgi:hypothetical protein